MLEQGSTLAKQGRQYGKYARGTCGNDAWFTTLLRSSAAWDRARNYTDMYGATVLFPKNLNRSLTAKARRM